ncbi:unnamed protein product [Rotaria magnacalcarata]|uniref:Sodefrin-like factor n=1 Tax=Rotaria magnacalcarata TaxID=392030 RepID=A0A816DR14_9BILA|nr:unnamed protein product [Rotaria magnacalcarata]
MRIIAVLISIAVLLICPVDSRKCYLCGCVFNWDTNSTTCSSVEFLSSCTLTEVGDKVCFITSSYNGNVEQRVFEAIAANIFQDAHFIQAVEMMSLSGTEWVQPSFSSMSYGCDWDGCNNISLAEYLPESFQITISQSILNSELLNGQLPAQHCYSCSACINNLTAVLCKQDPCTNGICYIDQIHSYLVTPTNNCTYNFFSTCGTFSISTQIPSIRVRATYYLDLPQEKQLEINEIELKCTKDYCNSIQTVELLKEQVQTKIILHPDFQPSRLSSTTTTTEVTVSVSATTTTGSISNRLYPIVYLIVFLIVFLL